MKFRSMIAAAAMAWSATVYAGVPAFPGAEGFGAGASGGRGGDVYAVTNLNDDGPGSLREGLKQGNRTIVFRVSGTIDLKTRLEVHASNITIAGQTAPGDGICLKGRELFFKNAENIVVRFLRLRPGDELKVEHDALTIWTCKDVIIDHCSLSWSTDSLNDVVKESGNVTVQWCILSEPLAQSVHAKGSHGYATGWDGRTRGGFSGHHNLIAHANSRAPRVGYLRNAGRGLIDVRNNVIYNSGPSYGGETDDFNYVGNYFRPGPTFDGRGRSIFDIWAHDSRIYVDANVIEGREEVLRDNATAIAFKQGKNADGTPATQPTREMCVLDKPVTFAPVTTHTAEQAYELVTRHAGARLPKVDSVDTRILSDVLNRTGKPINSQADVGGWPELKSDPAPTDTDHDGMPDAWESAHGLNPNDASDGKKEATPGGYTNLEIYLNELAAPAMPPAK
jgi:pectate lyase